MNVLLADLDPQPGTVVELARLRKAHGLKPGIADDAIIAGTGADVLIVDGPTRDSNVVLLLGLVCDVNKLLLLEHARRHGGIRHYGLLSGGTKVEAIATARELLAASEPDADGEAVHDQAVSSHPCPACGGRMHIVETFEAGCQSTIGQRQSSASIPHERTRRLSPSQSPTPLNPDIYRLR
jgi:hypothetical protein